ncbi:hypothetical protein IRZ71_15270 [Flavobacterium sp. ANB]|uniref:hypothetical protein n=1 Tax=unclassified Flavobacterium TaxID=196869 RepID=UPI0012B82202|nr:MULTISPECIES: hypothetical protein [unclassified Flavobacterium]MBF4517724.1 hypothetical protein [Flavobacterium sp. ANB]MTD70451.1 hypothetical protein [Flavobacterium sp. LC2016-13]
MKTIKNTNTFALALPLAILLTYPFIQEGALIFSLLSTIITGFLQFSIGVKMLVDSPKNKDLQKYMAGVVLFFILWLTSFEINYNDLLSYAWFAMPPILAIYLTLIIHKIP